MHYLQRKRLMATIWRRIKLVFKILWRTFWGLLLLVFLLWFAVLGWLAHEFWRTPEVKPDTTLVMNMQGFILDGPSIAPVAQRVLGEDVQTRQGIINNLRKAAEDDRIIGLLMNLEGYYMDYVTALEIREELLEFRRSGKRVFAFMNTMGMTDYLLASTADTIYMPLSGTTYVRGMRFEVGFYREMLDNIGITPEFVAIGEYKTAPQMFTTGRMSDEYREVLNDILDTHYGTFVTKVAEGRDVSEEQVKTWVDNGLYSAQEALEAGMIDELVYETELEKTIQVALGLLDETALEADDIAADKEEQAEQPPQDEEAPEFHTLNNSQYARVKVKAPRLHKKGQKIAVIYAQGPIGSGRSTPPSSGAPTIGSETMTQLLDTLANDEKIKGIIMRVDSGGGGARASDIINHSVRKARRKKPLVVSMASAAASGGYMISAPADSIIAYPETLTGSIGIFGGKFSSAGLYDFIGLNVEIVKRGKNAAMFTDARARTPEEQERYRHYIQQGYDQFLESVARGREMSVAAVDEVARGRVWTGEQAVEIGLVDQLGGMETAIAVIKDKLDIPADEDVQLVDYPRIEDPFSLLIKRLRETYVEARLPADVRQMLAYLKNIAHFQDEQLFAWWPVQLVVE
jgi:protease IV